MVSSWSVFFTDPVNRVFSYLHWGKHKPDPVKVCLCLGKPEAVVCSYSTERKTVVRPLPRGQLRLPENEQHLPAFCHKTLFQLYNIFIFLRDCLHRVHCTQPICLSAGLVVQGPSSAPLLVLRGHGKCTQHLSSCSVTSSSISSHQQTK